MTSASSLADLASRLHGLTRIDGTPVRALVVEDEPDLANLLAKGVRLCGWEAHVAEDGPSAVRAARALSPDLLVLDRMLPGFDGIQVLRRIRVFLPDVPALFLTAKDLVEDRIDGLIAGGDDYVAKPFSLEEVLVRLHRLVQRSGNAFQDSAILVVGDLVLNADTHDVTRAGEPLRLSATQFRLLRYLMENPRQVLSKAQILSHVWDYDFSGQPTVVELYISYLRRSVDAGRAPMIHTLRGVGYVLKPAL